MVVAEQRETVVVEAAREVGDVDAEHELPDLHGLVPRRVAGSEEQEHRAVAEEVVVAVHELERAVGVGVVARAVEVPLDGGVVVPGRPFVPLHHERHLLGNQRQRAGVVEVQVREHDPGDRRQVDLVGDAQLLLQREGPDGLRALGVKAGVDEDPLAVGLDQVGRNRIAHRLIHVIARAQKP